MKAKDTGSCKNTYFFSSSALTYIVSVHGITSTPPWDDSCMVVTPLVLACFSTSPALLEQGCAAKFSILHGWDESPRQGASRMTGRCGAQIAALDRMLGTVRRQSVHSLLPDSVQDEVVNLSKFRAMLHSVVIAHRHVKSYTVLLDGPGQVLKHYRYIKCRNPITRQSVSYRPCCPGHAERMQKRARAGNRFPPLLRCMTITYQSGRSAPLTPAYSSI